MNKGNMGASANADRAATPSEPSPAVSGIAGIPSAVARLRENAEALDKWLKSFDEHVRSASDPLFGRGYGLEEKLFDLFQITGRIASSIYQGLLDTASAIEASRAETQSGSVHESAIPNGETP